MKQYSIFNRAGNLVKETDQMFIATNHDDGDHYCFENGTGKKLFDLYEINSVSVEVEISFSYNEKTPNVIDIDGPKGYVKGKDGGEVYFDQVDGTSLLELMPAIEDRLPEEDLTGQFSRNGAFLAHWDGKELKKLDKKTFKILFTQTFIKHENGEEEWLENDVELIKE